MAALSLLSSLAAAYWIEKHRPQVHDEFAYLLQAQTFAEGRLTNPPLDLPEFFQTPHVLLSPTYTAKYPPGHAVFLALGIRLGHPIFGVWLENALFAASLAWMLLVFVPPRWAIAGGVLALVQLGGLHHWTQSFWITPMAAAGGALVWGAAFAIRKRRRVVDGLLLGAGVGLLMFSRPFEGLLACIVPCGVLIGTWVRTTGKAGEHARLLRSCVLPAGLIVGLCFLATGIYNRSVTGDFLRFPYAAYESAHSGQPLFVWQSDAEQPLQPFQATVLRAYHERFVVPMSNVRTLSLGMWGERMFANLEENLGWCLAPLALAGAALAFFRKTSPPWARLATLAVLVSSLGFLVSIWFDSRYYIPFVPPLMLLAVFALRRGLALWPRGRGKIGWLTAAAAAGTAAGVVFIPYPERSLAFFRQAQPVVHITEQLAHAPGKFLILVEALPVFDKNKIHRTYLANAPHPAESKVVWAWDLGVERNAKLIAHYPGRHIFQMKVFDGSVSFLPYSPPTTQP